MRKKKIISMFLSATMFLSLMNFSGRTLKATANQMTENEVSSYIDQMISKMTLKQKIGQKLMLSFRSGWTMSNGTKVKSVTTLNDEIASIIGDYDIGSVILFATNLVDTEQSLKLTEDLQAAAMSKDYAGGTLPLIIATDQEGGSVYRLNSGTALPGNMALGATGSTEDTHAAGAIIGRELKALGINTNFAPDSDVNNNPANPVIGLRSFSSNPELAAKMVVPYIKGVQDSNVSTTLKHFPGHGDTGTDSHTGLPRVDKSYDEIKKCELVTFQAGINSGTDMVMTAHIQYPKIEDTKVISKKDGQEIYLPATMSHKILTDILRNDMGFKGVIVTDSMTMGAVTDNFGTVDANIKAIAAGVDILDIPITDMSSLKDISRLEELIDGIAEAYNDGTLDIKELDASIKRILTLKYNRGILNLNNDTTPWEEKLAAAKSEVGSAKNHAIERDISAHAVTVVKNRDNILPFTPKAKDKILFLTPYNNEIPGLNLGIARAIAEGLIDESVTYNAERYTSASMSTESFNELKEKIDGYNYVIVVSEATSQSQMASDYYATKFPNDVAAYCYDKNIDCAVLSIGKPYEAACYKSDKVKAVAIAYGAKGMDATNDIYPTNTAFGPNIIAGVEVIFGRYGATGKLPVDIPDVEGDLNTMNPAKTLYPLGFSVTYPAVGSVDKSKLKDIINMARDFIANKGLEGVTSSISKKVNNALIAAESVYDKKNSTQNEIDESAKGLNEAINLVNNIKEDKVKLGELIKECENVDLTKYEDQCKDEFVSALTEAKKIYEGLADENISEAINKLNASKNNLKAITDDDSKNDVEENSDNDKENNDANAPKTGDNTNIILLVAVAIISGVGIIALIYKKKKKIN